MEDPESFTSLCPAASTSLKPPRPGPKEAPAGGFAQTAPRTGTGCGGTLLPSLGKCPPARGHCSGRCLPGSSPAAASRLGRARPRTMRPNQVCCSGTWVPTGFRLKFPTPGAAPGALRGLRIGVRRQSGRQVGPSAHRLRQVSGQTFRGSGSEFHGGRVTLTSSVRKAESCVDPRGAEVADGSPALVWGCCLWTGHSVRGCSIFKRSVPWPPSHWLC